MTRPFVCVVSGTPGTGKSALADAIAVDTHAAVVNWDWLMSALRVFPEVWDPLVDRLETRRDIGYELMARMIESRLRIGQSTITDCVARPRALAMWATLAARYDAPVFVVECSIDDAQLQRTRVEGRIRAIPGWDELDWDHVQRSRLHYEPLPEPKLRIDSARPFTHNLAAVSAYLGLDS